MAHAEIQTSRVVVVFAVLPDALVDVEAGRQGPVEQPRLGEADGALLRVSAGADPDRRLPAPAQEVPLGQVDRADQGVDRRVAAADAEDAGRSLHDLDVHDDLGLVGAGLGRDVHAVEIAQVHELLPGAVPFLERVELALAERELAAQDLVLAAHVAVDVDALDVHLGAFGDLERHVDQAARRVLVALGVDVGRGAADRAVQIQDPLGALADLAHREDVTGLELDLAGDLALRHQRDAGDVHVPDLELWPLDHRDRDRHARFLSIDRDVVRVDSGLDVPVVVVQGDDPVDVEVEPLALNLATQDEVLPLPRLHRVLDLGVGEALVASEHDLFDRDLAPLGDAEDQPHVAVAELLDVRRDLDLEVPFVLVVIAELLDRALHVDRVVDAAQLDVDLVLQGVPVALLVAGEIQVADEGALEHHERHPHPALEVVDPHLDVVEEAEAEDGADVVAENIGVEGHADGLLDAAQDHGVLDPSVALDVDVLDDDRRRRLLRFGGSGNEEAGGQDGKHRQTHSARRRHRALRRVRTAC